MISNGTFGCVTGFTEYELNLAFALKLQKELYRDKLVLGMANGIDKTLK